ncbi:hypothetical protein [Kosakonia pseudosacchari]|nr:hypothetical protein [Kosakonia pseudosacchari]
MSLKSLDNAEPKPVDGYAQRMGFAVSNKKPGRIVRAGRYLA